MSKFIKWMAFNSLPTHFSFEFLVESVCSRKEFRLFLKGSRFSIVVVGAFVGVSACKEQRSRASTKEGAL